jgi:hypothetical protein
VVVAVVVVGVVGLLVGFGISFGQSCPSHDCLSPGRLSSSHSRSWTV